jgi:hypothetical protein
MNNIEILKTISKYKVEKCSVHRSCSPYRYNIVLELNHNWLFVDSHGILWADFEFITDLEDYMEKYYDKY